MDFRLIILIIGGVLIVGYFLLIVFPIRNLRFLKINKNKLKEQINSDMKLLVIYLEGIEQAYKNIEKNKKFFQKNPKNLKFEEKEKLLGLWSVYLDYSLELEKLKEVHKHFYKINYITHPKLNLRSFLIAYSSFVANHRYSLLLQDLIGKNKLIEAILNEEKVNLSIPKDGYFYLKTGNTNPETLIRLNAGFVNLKFLKKTKKLKSTLEKKLVNYASKGYFDSYKIGGESIGRFIGNPISYFKKKTFDSWFPFQVSGSKRISIVRTTMRGNFITLNQIKKIRQEMQPGDIMLQRRNWYLTNIGLPGFWPHSAIFIGNLKEMDSYFNGISILKGKSASEYIKKKNPEIYKVLSKKQGSVIESKKEGIIIQSLEESAMADYLSVLRPGISKEDKFNAILESFRYYGRPYDYDFNFVTDNALVCSELVSKSYASKKSKKGIKFDLEEMAGRLILPPNNFVKKFDEEYGTKKQELDFVLFLDGSEKRQKAVRKGLKEFRKTWKRLKWDLVQQ